MTIGVNTFGAEKIKVACVGNSITENYALPANEKYPAILQQLLGDQYEVKNYGIGGRTLLKKGDLPYWNEAKYQEVLNWKPDIVIIKLGTNDSKPQNWAYKNEFESNYIEFINSFKSLSSTPTVYICKPLPAYTNTMNIKGSVIANEILPKVESVAAQAGVSVIDLYSALEGKPSYLYDAVHPNVFGTTIMANVICKALNPEYQIPDNLYTQVSPFDRTDYAVSVTASKTYDQANLNNLIDNDANTEFSGGSFTAGMWITIELPELFKITGYSLVGGKGDSKNSPRKWTLQGSADNSSWTDIETRSDQDFLRPADTQIYQPSIPDNRENIKAYKYFRIVFNQNNGGSDLNLSELQIFGFPAKLVTNITGNGGAIKAQYAGYTGEGVENLITDLISKKYCVLDKKGGWIDYESTTEVLLDKYSLTSCVTDFDRNPKSWELLGYNKVTGTWDILDQQTNQNFLVRFNTMDYKITTSKAYSKFRLNITENNGSNTFQFCKWQLFGVETTQPVIKKKVACIGNSITANGKLPLEEKYVTILQNLLGDGYDVRNFGESGATLLKKGAHPYWKQAVYASALSFVPDILVIKLGTNDSRGESWKYKDEFVSDYIEFINSFKAINPKVEVYTCYPIPAWPNTMDIKGDIIKNDIIPMITSIAETTDAKIIDLHTPMQGKIYSLYDFVHPDVRGTTIMATTIYKTLEPTETINIDLKQPSNVTTFDRTDLIVKSQSSAQSLDINNLFDNDLNTEYHFGSFSPNSWMEIELPEEFRVTGYALTSASGDTSNAPKSWRLEGSNDRVAWIAIDSQTNQRFTLPTETNMYQTEIEGNTSTNAQSLPTYKYFRIVFEANQGGSNLSLSEWQLYGHNKTMVTTITGNGGSITSQYTGYQNGAVVETVDKLITNSIAEKYCAPGKKNGWVQYKSTENLSIEGYSLTCGISNFDRNPTAWELSASTDGVNWKTLDSQSNQTFTLRLNTVVYPIESLDKYNYFKLNILENNGGSDFQFSKWQLFKRAETISLENDMTVEGIDVYSGENQISIKSLSDSKYEIYNSSGFILESGAFNGDVSIPIYTPGLYIVKVSNLEKGITSKVIVN